MVATPSIALDLRDRGFRNLVRWSRGVDMDLFKPRPDGYLPYDRPIQLYVGRVAIEKNIEVFLSLQTKGTKVIVGDGPEIPYLRKNFSEAVFVGARFGEELAKYYSDADVLVFPSKTDTFGLVIIEALASGTPVAAFPVAGPLDIIGNSGAGVLNDDLSVAIEKALHINADTCRSHAKLFSWSASANQFLNNLIHLY
jgi:glycosyltransferase involved in cell wall biosynthesis